MEPASSLKHCYLGRHIMDRLWGGHLDSAAQAADFLQQLLVLSGGLLQALSQLAQLQRHICLLLLYTVGMASQLPVLVLDLTSPARV